jgi:hypothetical protein
MHRIAFALEVPLLSHYLILIPKIIFIFSSINMGFLRYYILICVIYPLHVFTVCIWELWLLPYLVKAMPLAANREKLQNQMVVEDRSYNLHKTTKFGRLLWRRLGRRVNGRRCGGCSGFGWNPIWKPNHMRPHLSNELRLHLEWIS